MYAEFADNRIIIHDSYLHKESIKQINGRLWDQDKKVWMIPFNEENILTLTLLGCELCGDLKVKINENKSRETSHEKPLLTMPIKVTPYQHQIKAFNYVCQIFGISGGEVVGYSQG